MKTLKTIIKVLGVFAAIVLMITVAILVLFVLPVAVCSYFDLPTVIAKLAFFIWVVSVVLTTIYFVMENP